ncbi:hypothetical protein CEXT_625871 [Caerostris extrusa]|uniref:Uncharacterized protein n=1 Tax=Caerostris extrusa TaxID=172846 RepID=A0AAV4XLA8_CAEEX|nr:hypothetical protein CEXT_625871 [Caerostris extrusa]
MCGVTYLLSDPIKFRPWGTSTPITCSADASDMPFWLLYLEKRIINGKVLFSRLDTRIRIRLISLNKEPLSFIAFNCTQILQLVVGCRLQRNLRNYVLDITEILFS